MSFLRWEVSRLSASENLAAGQSSRFIHHDFGGVPKFDRCSLENSSLIDFS
jgi:hypothetical protein